MKTNHLFIAILAASACCFASCENLDLQPESTTTLMEDEVWNSYEGIHGSFLKLYGAMGPQSMGGQGGNDVNFDGGRSAYLRSLFWSQECASDIVMYRTAASYGVKQACEFTWTPGTEFPQYIYYRAYIIIAMANDFLRRTQDGALGSGIYGQVKDELPYWRAEARFIRAYQYYLLCDLFGSVGFVDETSPNGTYPVQRTRKEIFEYVERELLAIENEMMPASRKVFGRANQVADWFLLAKLYINGKVYAGSDEYYGKAYTYAKKVVDDTNFSLAPNYIENFLKDNDTCKEIIWAMPSDFEHMKGEGMANYLIKFPTTKDILSVVDYGISEQWGGNGALRYAFVTKFSEADQNFDPTDTWGDKKGDKRALLFVGPGSAVGTSEAYVKETWIDGEAFNTKKIYIGASFTKWRNVTKDRIKASATTYASVAFPIFRKADAYLIAAEAIMRRDGKADAEALGYVNEVRDRAYCRGNYQSSYNTADGRITLDELTFDFLIDERARELWTENWRRSDLIRFDRYTKNYNWDWKGRSTSNETNHEGRDVDDKYKLYPIPQDDVLYNPYIHQNPDYE